MLATKDKFKDLGRLKKRSDFLHAQTQGKKWVSPSMVVQLVANEAQGHRFGVTATKKISTRAVDRNRIKRRLRAVACDVLPEFAPINHDIVLIGRLATLDKPYEDMCKDLRWCLRRLQTAPDSP